MTREEYEEKINFCNKFAGPATDEWNFRFLYCLDREGLEVKPLEYVDANGLDMEMPLPYHTGLPTWPRSKIGVK